jgi:hypothetical protein
MNPSIFPNQAPRYPRGRLENRANGQLLGNKHIELNDDAIKVLGIGVVVNVWGQSSGKLAECVRY